MKIKQVIVSTYGAKVVAVGEDNKIYRWNEVSGEWELKLRSAVDIAELAKTRYSFFKKLAGKVFEWDQLEQTDRENHIAALKHALQQAGLVKF